MVSTVTRNAPERSCVLVVKDSLVATKIVSHSEEKNCCQG